MANVLKKIVCISDTHCRRLKLPEGDILIHSGDWSGRGDQSETEDFIRWMEEVEGNYKAIVVVPGNHDRWVMANTPEAKKKFKDAGIIFLEDEYNFVEGLHFYGMPWTPIFGRWAYMSDDRGRALRCGAIQSPVDVLVTHGPPYGIMDEVLDWNKHQFRNVGCPHILEAVKRVKPKLHTFGHIHEGSGIHVFDTTLMTNASIMDKLYNPVNAPKIVYL